METKVETGRKRKPILSVEMETGPILPMETKGAFLVPLVSKVSNQLMKR